MVWRMLWLAYAVTCGTRVDVTSGMTIHVAFLAPENSDGGQYNVSTSVAALVFALETIENETGLLDDHYLNVTWYDTRCDQKNAAGKAVDIYMTGMVDMFLGPPCSSGMQAVASLASYWNLASFGWHSGEMGMGDKTIYSTLVRSFGSVEDMGDIMADAFYRFGWSRGAMITCKDDSSSMELGDAIERSFQAAGILVTQRYLVNSNATLDELEDIFTHIQLTARIVVISIELDEIRKYMLLAFDLSMTSGEYVFWTTNAVPENDWRYGNESWIGSDGRDEDARKAMDALFHLTIADSITTSYSERRTMESWKHEALAIAEKPRWQELYPPAVMMWVYFLRSITMCLQGDAYSPYLSDALYLYAVVVNETLAGGLSHTDGHAIFNKSKEQIFNGTTGRVLMLEDADRAMDAWMLDMDEDGYFEISAVLYWVVTPNGSHAERLSIRPPRWPSGLVGEEHAPPDQPVCGFLGEKCPSSSNSTDLIIGITVAVLALCVLLLGIAVYRRRKFEATMQRMLWKVSYDDINFRIRERLLGSRNSSMQKTSMSGGNASLDLCGQLFARVGVYKGNYVAVRKVRKQSIRLTKDVIMDINTMKEVSHNNLNTFIGACVESPNICVLWQYCSKGSLQDVIFDDNIKLDMHFKCSILADTAKGMEYLHHSRVGSHGRLKSSNVIIDSRWTCKVTDFGLDEFFQGEGENGDLGEHTRYSDLFWRSPELLRQISPPRRGTPKGDIYSFAVICKEVICRNGPYSDYDNLSPKEIIESIRQPGGDKPFRPLLTCGEDVGMEDGRQYQEMLMLPKHCWLEEPQQRPSFSKILKWIHRIHKGSTNIIDNMISMLEKYANNLEDIVAERTEQLQDEKKKTDTLLYRMLPLSVAESLKHGHAVQAEWFDDVTIYFSDIEGFTSLAALSTPMQVVDLLNDLYTMFDDITTNHDVYKVETIGDAYMIVSGLPEKNGTRHVCEISSCALDILQSVGQFSIRHLPNIALRIRIGLHSGPCCAGVVGLAMPRYCLFGDTVNTASRMESSGEAMKIHVSDTTSQGLRHFPSYQLQSRGEVPIKGKGTMTTHWLLGKTENHKCRQSSTMDEEVHLIGSPDLSADVERKEAAPSDSVFENDFANMEQETLVKSTWPMGSEDTPQQQTRRLPEDEERKEPAPSDSVVENEYVSMSMEQETPIKSTWPVVREDTPQQQTHGLRLEAPESTKDPMELGPVTREALPEDALTAESPDPLLVQDRLLPVIHVPDDIPRLDTVHTEAQMDDAILKLNTGMNGVVVSDDGTEV